MCCDSGDGLNLAGVDRQGFVAVAPPCFCSGLGSFASVPTMIRLLLACLLLAGGLAEAGEAAASVAVIGGGVAGASASYYIRRSLGAGASVTV